MRRGGWSEGCSGAHGDVPVEREEGRRHGGGEERGGEACVGVNGCGGGTRVCGTG